MHRIHPRFQFHRICEPSAPLQLSSKCCSGLNNCRLKASFVTHGMTAPNVGALSSLTKWFTMAVHSQSVAMSNELTQTQFWSLARVYQRAAQFFSFKIVEFQRSSSLGTKKGDFRFLWQKIVESGDLGCKCAILLCHNSP